MALKRRVGRSFAATHHFSDFVSFQSTHPTLVKGPGPYDTKKNQLSVLPVNHYIVKNDFHDLGMNITTYWKKGQAFFEKIF